MMKQRIKNYIKAFGHGLKPIPRLLVWEWADQFRRLTTESSAEPGKYRTSRTPYLQRPMECLSAHETYKKIVVMKGAQLGFSESGANFIGYAIHIAPAPFMYVLPTEKMVEKFSKVRIDPMIKECPELAERVAASKSRDSRNTIMQKSFNGGTLYFAGANSAAGLRSVPVRYLVLDEVDAYPQDLDDEGSPVELAIARTRTFPNRKIFIISTPTVSGLSVVEKEFENTDQNYYHVPCPFCGGLQTLIMSQLIWPEGKPREAKYKCVHCGEMIPERHKVTMLEQGHWIPSKPENANLDTIGFHLNSLYSPLGWYSWAEVAEDWIAAQESQMKLKTFINTTLGETWQEKGEAPPYKNLYNRREEYKENEVPPDVCFLTAGVDVQKDRIELEVVGWCADKRSYSICYRALLGDTAKGEVWDELAEVVNERWVKKRGGELGLLKMAIDTGYNTSHVHAFCRRFDGGCVIPIKGVDGLGMAYSPPKAVDRTQAGKKIGKFKQWNIGVSFLKSELYSHLRLEKNSEGVPPPYYCHFPQYDEHYFRGLTAEELMVKYVKGYRRPYWIKRYERNEPLDCRIYARAAAAIIGLDRMTPDKIAALSAKSTRKKAIGTTGKKSAVPPRKKRESNFW